MPAPRPANLSHRFCKRSLFGLKAIKVGLIYCALQIEFLTASVRCWCVVSFIRSVKEFPSEAFFVASFARDEAEGIVGR